MSDWASLIAQVVESKADRVPAEYKSRFELEKEFNLSQAQTIRRIRELVAAKLVERREFSIVVNGQLRKVPHYRRV